MTLLLSQVEAKRRKLQNRLTDREMRFLAEYQVDFNIGRALGAAGYTPTSYSVCKRLLKKPVAKKYLARQLGETHDELKLTREEIIANLYYLATRDAADFTDESGMIITDVRKLPVRARKAIDGIKQTVKHFKDDRGLDVTTVTTELKLVSKASAMDMAMKHKGLFAAEKTETKVTVEVDWDTLFFKKQKLEEKDELDQKLIALANGNYLIQNQANQPEDSVPLVTGESDAILASKNERKKVKK